MQTVKWYTYARNGIVYVQFKDKITGDKLTAKSTGTKDRDEALATIHKWYYDPDSFFNKTQKEHDIELLKQIVTDSRFTKNELADIFTDLFATLGKSIQVNVSDATMINTNADMYTARATNGRQSALYPHPPEIQEMVQKLDALTLVEYLLLFWDYEKSPYIKQLLRTGKTPPNPERFATATLILKKHARLAGDMLLTNTGADDINTWLGKIRQSGNLQESSLAKIRYTIVQALRFAYDNKFLHHDMSRDITVFSRKCRKKEIFTKDELLELFSPQKNVFGNEEFLLLNKLLFVTGCRIGELQALQVGDLFKTKSGYQLRINKNYCTAGMRLKSTKTEREDDVPISNEIAEEIMAFIKTNPFGADAHAFIFYSRRRDVPLSYNSINKNFNTTVRRLGMKRDNLTIHSYRHTYTSLLQDAGFSDLDLLYLTRHEDIKQIRRYGDHETPAKELKKRKAVRIISKMLV